MQKIGLFFNSDTGVTEEMGEKIQNEFAIVFSVMAFIIGSQTNR